MIKIDFQEPNTHEWNDWKAKCQTEQLDHNNAIAQGQDSKVKTEVYKGTNYNIKKDVYLNPKGPFWGKCAYCESNIAADQPGDIEHYRPKSAIKDGNNDDIVIEIDGSNVPHPGYYWLAYNWQNLLPSCRDCNSVTKAKTGGQRIGKGNLFPVKNFRAVLPGQEDLEEPLILNPLFDNPADHLSIDSTGIISEKSKEGKVCLDIFGLNKREALVTARKETYDNIRTLTKMYFVALLMDSNDRAKHYEKLKSFKDGKQPYSIAGIQAIKDTVKEHHASIRKLDAFAN